MSSVSVKTSVPQPGLPSRVYRPALGLLTDLYQLTMAQGYMDAGEQGTEAVFNLFFRKHPFKGGYTIASGLEHAVDYLQNLRFDEEDVAYLETVTGNDGKPLFRKNFLDYLRDLEFTCDLDAVPEGTVVFPHEPLLRVKGPLIQCQLVETALLNLINFQTLIATKAARVVQAAGDEPVLEFGLRRAQGIDGGLSVARAAFVGGVAATSNVLAGRLYDIPIKGTHAHSWVMCFDSELEAFERYAEAMPNNCVFLVDTYDTVEGVKHAIQVGEKLRERGYEMVGIRLDSGDLCYLSQRARELLDEAGFPDASIVASNSLDEYTISSLKTQGARIDTWGVGTRLSTAYDQPALGGVYKLASVRREDGPWEDRIKLSEQAIKVSNPGLLRVRRYLAEDGKTYAGDLIYDERLGADGDVVMIDPMDMTRRKHLAHTLDHVELLEPVLRQGELVEGCCVVEDSLKDMRARAKEQLSFLHKGIRRFDQPHQYPVGLEMALYERKTRMILEARGHATHPSKP